MHDRTRRMICRAGFLAVCVLPTLAVAAWCAAQTSVAHRTACAVALSRACGLRVALAEVSYPRPGITLYRDVALADPETAAPLARMRFIEMRSGGDPAACVVSQPEIDAARLGRLWQIVARRMRQPAGDQSLFRLAAAEATLHGPRGSQTLTEVLGQLDSPSGAAGERIATLSFRIAGVDSPEPIKLRCVRTAATAPPTDHVELPAVSHVELPAVSHVELETGGAAVPVWLLAAPLGIADRLGERARFRGSIWATETADGWDGEISGQFTDVDLQAVVTEQFPHRLSGTADITIRKARFHRGRLEEASGTFAAGPGVISRSLVRAAAENLHLAATAPEPSRTLIRYDRLAFSFVIDASGLTLGGQCRNAPGAILRRGQRTLLAESGGSAAPVVALLRTLAPRSDVQVPATRETDWLMRRLPVPDVMPPADQPPQAKLRLDDGNGEESGTNATKKNRGQLPSS